MRKLKNDMAKSRAMNDCLQKEVRGWLVDTRRRNVIGHSIARTMLSTLSARAGSAVRLVSSSVCCCCCLCVPFRLLRMSTPKHFFCACTDVDDSVQFLGLASLSHGRGACTNHSSLNPAPPMRVGCPGNKLKVDRLQSLEPEDNAQRGGWQREWLNGLKEPLSPEPTPIKVSEHLANPTVADHVTPAAPTQRMWY